MSDNPETSRVAIRDLSDLVGIVPYLVGFRPEESLVIVVTEQAHVRLTGRLDLCDIHQLSLPAFLARISDRFASADFWFLAYTDDIEMGWGILEQCARTVEGHRLGRIIQVNSSGWVADERQGPFCAHATAAAAAHAAALGLPVIGEREDLARRLSGPPDDAIDGLLERFDQAVACVEGWSYSQRCEQLTHLVRQACDERDLVVLAVLAADPIMQRAAIAELDRAHAAQALDQWAKVVNVALTPWVSGPVGLTGLSAWIAGEGALHTICLEYLEKLGCTDVLAAVLGWINHDVVPPESWPHTQQAVLAAFDERHPRPPGPSD